MTTYQFILLEEYIELRTRRLLIESGVVFMGPENQQVLEEQIEKAHRKLLNELQD